VTEQANGAVTRTDPGADEWMIDDEVIQLREWGTHHIHAMPPPGEEWTIGAAETCAVKLVDPTRRVSREHARLSREHSRWTIRDLGSKNGTRLDGARRHAFPLAPGVEVGIGRITLIAESQRLTALRNFLERLLGWGTDRIVTVDRALRAVRTAATRRGALLVCGDGDLVPLAQSVHRQTLGEARPFVVCDPRRRSAPASVRSAQSHSEGMHALEAAAGGTMCVWARRLPRDFRDVSLALRDPSSRVQLVVCSNEPADARTMLADPVVIPSLGRRRGDLERIVEEYARDAIVSFGAAATGVSRADRDWVITHSASSLPEIEKGTRRLAAIRLTGSLARAAGLLGMSHVALSQWIGRRRLPEGPRRPGVETERGARSRLRSTSSRGGRSARCTRWSRASRAPSPPSASADSRRACPGGTCA
jgi:pSer/pThr/pTyr-binding forkhead associated (FHA) protein